MALETTTLCLKCTLMPCDEHRPKYLDLTYIVSRLDLVNISGGAPYCEIIYHGEQIKVARTDFQRVGRLLQNFLLLLCWKVFIWSCHVAEWIVRHYVAE